MRRMLLAVFAIAAFGLSAGVASADVVCSPVCGLVSPGDAQNLRVNDGKQRAGQNISEKGVAGKNNAGLGQSSGSGDNGGSTVVLF